MIEQRMTRHAKTLRRDLTDTERLLWRHVRAHRLQGAEFKRQQPIGPYVADFVCFEARLIIEVDGSQHSDRADYDAKRDEWLRNQGFRVLRFWNNEVMSNMEGVLEHIIAELTVLPSPPPLSQNGRGG